MEILYNEAIATNNDIKYMLDVNKKIIPKHILSSDVNIACDNCKIYIYDKILDKHYFMCCECNKKFINGLNLIMLEKIEIMQKKNEYMICTENYDEFNNLKKRFMNFNSGKNN